MSRCPDENTVTALMEGRLTDLERRELEEHCDACPRCASLLVELGRMAAPTSSTPSQLDDTMAKRYRLLEPVGAGAMGVVFAAFDAKLSRKVAIKRLRVVESISGSDAYEERKRRFLREAQLLASLSHPNVLTVHDIGTIDGELAIVVELVDGWSASRWLQECRPTRRQVLQVFRQAGEGLAAAHRVGIVHRDVKPDNILVSRSGRVLVTDFGLAGLIEAGSARHVAAVAPTLDGAVGDITRTGEVLGTPAYMAPEQRRGCLGDHRSDQYAFCASLYEALHARRFIEQAGRFNRRKRAAWDRALARIDTVLGRGLAADAAERFASMEELLTALERAGASRRAPAVAAASAGALLAAAAIAVLTLRSSVAPRSRTAADAQSTLAAQVPPGLKRAMAALDRRDGQSCIDALDEALRAGPLIGEAWVRGRCEMLRGRCDEGRRLLAGWVAREVAEERGGPEEKRLMVNDRVREHALMLCPPDAFDGTSDGYLALARQAAQAEAQNNFATCRKLDRDLTKLLPKADLEAAYRTCRAFEEATWPETKQALLEHRNPPSRPRPESCEEPRSSIAHALSSLGRCLIAAGDCREGARHLHLSEIVEFQDQSGATNLAQRLEASYSALRPDYRVCAVALDAEMSTARQAQRVIDRLDQAVRAEPAVGERGGELDRDLAGFGLRCVRTPAERTCRLVPLR